MPSARAPRAQPGAERGAAADEGAFVTVDIGRALSDAPAQGSGASAPADAAGAGAAEGDPGGAARAARGSASELAAAECDGGGEAPVCRICMVGDAEEDGAGPLCQLSCGCRGGMRLAHAACAERWFLSRGARRGRHAAAPRRAGAALAPRCQPQ
jgi:hypothetical protein